ARRASTSFKLALLRCLVALAAGRMAARRLRAALTASSSSCCRRRRAEPWPPPTHGSWCGTWRHNPRAGPARELDKPPGTHSARPVRMGRPLALAFGLAVAGLMVPAAPGCDNCTVVRASSFDQSCKVDADCAAVIEDSC